MPRSRGYLSMVWWCFAVSLMMGLIGCWHTSVDVETSPTGLTFSMGWGVSMELVRIPAGSFDMGSPATEADRFRNEGPLRTVTFSNPFYMAVTPVTQAQWEAIMQSNPSHFEGANRPVENVTLDDARDFCDRLSELTGRYVRLPTEAEWEYACRAGSTDARYGELETIAWYRHNSDDSTHDVGLKRPNAWGLYDMLGNVFEWCEDDYWPDYEEAPVDGSAVTGTVRSVIRGGAWLSPPAIIRAACRMGVGAEMRNQSTGFRVVIPTENPVDGS